MILNNTQANIFKVNGGIADNFANRPAASGSFYIFYSIDTQEIYYDNGAWVLIGSGGGGGVPNWDQVLLQGGVFTGNRSAQLNDFLLSFSLGFGKGVINFKGINNTIYTEDQLGGNAIGLKLDFANGEFQYGDFGFINNGLRLQCLVNEIYLGDSNYIGFYYNYINKETIIGDTNNNLAATKFITDVNNQIIKTSNQGNDIGLNLNFANSVYQFGEITGGNTTYLYINDTIQQFSVFNQLQSKGIFLDFQSNRYFYGIYNGLNQAYIEVDASQQRIITKGTTPGQPRGLDLLPNSSQYYFGNSSDLNRTYIQVNDTVQNIITSNQGLVKGLDINFGAKTYRFGQLNGGNSTYLDINDLSNRITVGSITGPAIDLNFPIKVYSFGNLGGGNQTFFSIADLAPHPIQFNGANVTSNTAGGASGQHLNVRINNVNYKIELRNP